MISNNNRFHGHGSLRYVYSKGNTVRGSLFAIKYVENKRRDTYRAAVVVSKKVHKNAVVRNRIRRRLYEAIRLVVPVTAPAYDIVITVFNEAVATVSYEELTLSLHAQLQQAGILPKR